MGTSTEHAPTALAKGTIGRVRAATAGGGDMAGCDDVVDDGGFAG
jgi:hypothetical protein